jgi:hypothetical protein
MMRDADSLRIRCQPSRIEADAARFYWTYDEFLITGNASLASGEQDRLNDWWRTSGSLMREVP